MVSAVVVAAGKGSRFGADINKVFCKLNGKSVLTRCIEALSESKLIDEAVLVISQNDQSLYEMLIKEEGPLSLITKVVYGGKTRQESVLNGLKSVNDHTDIVAIHDAARPFVTVNVIDETIKTVMKCGAAVPAKPVVDTIKITDLNGFAVETPDRSRLAAVQTPQVFAYHSILEAHEKAIQDGYVGTDDASLYEKYIGPVKTVILPECERNIKITMQHDLLPYQQPEYRCGLGSDTHRLVEGRKLILCGVEIPYEKGLLGHSDADVAIHALMDALLGAAGMGDIGRHFPDNDDKYKDISSMILLENVMNKLKDKGFSVVNADITITAQRPKLKDYMLQMLEKTAVCIGIPKDHVNIKATTTEHLGYEGRGEGISAQAVVMLKR